MTRALLASTALLFAMACGGAPKTTESLITDVRGFGDGVRWGKPAQAASRLPPAERDAFLDERAELDDELRVDDYEVLRVSLREPDGDRAEVRIEWTWHLDRKGIVHTTITGQDWERHGKRWILVDQRHVSGEPMPGVADPVDDVPADDDLADDDLADDDLAEDDLAEDDLADEPGEAPGEPTDSAAPAADPAQAGDQAAPEAARAAPPDNVARAGKAI